MKQEKSAKGQWVAVLAAVVFRVIGFFVWVALSGILILGKEISEALKKWVFKN